MQPLTTACRPAQQGAANVNEKRSEEHQQTFGGLVGGGLRQEGTGLEGAINISAAEEEIIILEKEKSSVASMQWRITTIITVEINCGSHRKLSHLESTSLHRSNWTSDCWFPQVSQVLCRQPKLMPSCCHQDKNLAFPINAIEAI